MCQDFRNLPVVNHLTPVWAKGDGADSICPTKQSIVMFLYIVHGPLLCYVHIDTGVSSGCLYKERHRWNQKDRHNWEILHLANKSDFGSCLLIWSNARFALRSISCLVHGRMGPITSLIKSSLDSRCRNEALSSRSHSMSLAKVSIFKKRSTQQLLGKILLLNSTTSVVRIVFVVLSIAQLLH